MPHAADYNAETIRTCLASHHLEELVDKSGVLVLGHMGAGKSTTISILLESVYSYTKNKQGQGEYILVSSITHTPQTAAGSVSKTLNIGVYQDKNSGLVYLDTGGLDENRGKEEALWSRNNLKILFSAVKELKSIIVVIDYRQAFASRGEGFKNLAEDIEKVISNEEIFYDSMIFVVTHGYNASEKILPNEIVSKAQAMLKEIDQQERKLNKYLEKMYPCENDDCKLDAIVHNRLTRRIVSEANETSVKYNIGAIPEDDKKQLKRLQATRALLRAIIKKEQNIILSYPDGKKACQQIRENIIEKIHSNEIITRDTLDKRNNRMEDENLLFLNVLSSIASDDLNNLGTESELIKKFIRDCENKKTLLENVERDWRGVQRFLITEREVHIKDLMLKLALNKEELARLQSSMEKVISSEQHVYKERNSGLLGLNFLFGMSRAVYEYAYSGQPFVSYELQARNEAFSVKVHENDQKDGKLRLRIESNNGQDLNLKIQVYVHEKDLPATLERVEVLKNLIIQIEEEVSNVNQQIISLNLIKTKEELDQEITNESNNIKEELRKIRTLFSVRITEDERFSKWETLIKLEKLFCIFKEKNDVLFESLPRATLETIKEFLKHCHSINNGLNNPHYKRFINDVLPEKTCSFIETDPPKKGKNMFFPQYSIGYTSRFYAAKSLKAQQLELSICGMFFALALWNDAFLSKETGEFSIKNTVAIFTFMFFLFTLLNHCRTKFEKVFLNIGKHTDERVGQFNHEIGKVTSRLLFELEKTNAATIGSMTKVTDELAKALERFKHEIDIQGNSLAQVKGISFGGT